MKRESTLKFICGRLLLVAAFILAYLMLALGNTAHAAGEFKGLEIISIVTQQKKQVARSLSVAKMACHFLQQKRINLIMGYKVAIMYLWQYCHKYIMMLQFGYGNKTRQLSKEIIRTKR